MPKTIFPIEHAIKVYEKSVNQPGVASNHLRLEVYQHDWLPGFAAFMNNGTIQKEAKAHLAINLGDLLNLVHAKSVTPQEVPYVLAETLMHEIMHALESWAKVEFNEEKIEALLTKYRTTHHD